LLPVASEMGCYIVLLQRFKHEWFITHLKGYTPNSL